MLTLGACSGDNSDVVVGAPTTTTTGGATAAGTTTVPQALDGASTTPVSVPAGSARALLKDVRSDHHPGFDRVVFEFESLLPGYEVKYMPRPVVEDGSGRTVEVAGAAVLHVRMENASGADLLGEKVRQTYTGANRIAPTGTTAVKELVRVGDFEAVLSWAVGVTSEAPFKVSALASPARLVVDVAAP